MKNSPFFILSILFFNCAGNEDISEQNETSDTLEASTDSTVSIVNTYEEAYNIFVNAFEPDMNNEIDTVVMSFVFPNNFFGTNIEPIRNYEILEQNLKVYIFRDDARIHYMAVFDRETDKVIDVRDFMEDDIQNFEAKAFYATGITLVKSKFVGGEETRALYIVDKEGFIHLINDLSVYDVPYIEEEYGFLTGVYHGDRYYTVNESTDIIGTHIVYDLQTNESLGKFATDRPCVFENDTLKLYVPGKYLGDSLSLSKLQLMEYRIHDGELKDSIPAGIMLMH